MAFKSFRTGLLFRVTLLTLSIFITLYLVLNGNKYFTVIVISSLIIFQIYDIFRYVENTNRKLSRFLDSVRFSDFSSTFTSDNQLGTSFKELNRSFNKVIEAFRKARSEKEEHFQYLQTLVKHVNVGLLSFDEDGRVGLMNTKAQQFLRLDKIKNIDQLASKNLRLHTVLKEIHPGDKTLVRESNTMHLAIHATEIRLRGKSFKLISIQNIQSELQQKELESWQNLTSVLRHEIMNSITPISSLTATMNEILKEDLTERNGHYEISDDTLGDLEEGLYTIENRSKGLINFVTAYRDYTNVPTPQFKKLKLGEVLDHSATLMNQEMKKVNVEFICETEYPKTELKADEELIEMVLINLLKNAKEAVSERKDGKVVLKGGLDEERKIYIKVSDNGSGIIPEAIDKIFMPFYTTKKTGSGIGLSLSKQIMQMHNGNLYVESEPDKGTTFTMHF
ncbi:ATP-binding protein [Fulvivirgaceae bacterium BMA10]|uniref:histidine kinase n=1 Tax=Splendidivirga corallicola TaxID=3051826 RepID=A0ABT8KHF8_9BACT|nr:ATP-binding protein [Fulvivirgaceae bacterium BMA10]